MVTLRRLLSGVMAVLVVSGVACKQPPSVHAPAQTETAPTAPAEVAALRVEANAGDADAQYNLGLIYELGDGVLQDYVQAATWYRKAAEQGHADAQYFLGNAYDLGEGVPQDSVQAVAWIRKAAEQGNANAQFGLAALYDNEQGVQQDYAQVAALLHKAAEQGHASAQYFLGLRYAKGQGVPQDYVESHKWHNLAASLAFAENQKQYAEGRDLVAKLMTPTQIEAAQKLASAWLAAFEKRGGK